MLPEILKPLFWDYDFGCLSLESDRELVIERVLASGTWKSVQWLRAHVPDSELREWFLRRRGRGLSRKQIRFWELILNLPHHEVNTWLEETAGRTWDQRARR